jgi:hypothetical protein
MWGATLTSMNVCQGHKTNCTAEPSVPLHFRAERGKGLSSDDAKSITILHSWPVTMWLPSLCSRTSRGHFVLWRQTALLYTWPILAPSQRRHVGIAVTLQTLFLRCSVRISFETLGIMARVFHSFPQPLQANGRIVHPSGHGRFFFRILFSNSLFTNRGIIIAIQSRYRHTHARTRAIHRSNNTFQYSTAFWKLSFADWGWLMG